MLLKVTDLVVCYDTAMVLNKASLEVNLGELVSLVGPNGAGKSTLMRCIAGLVRWERDTLKGTRYGDITIKGSVLFEGEHIDKLKAHEVVGRGLVLCPERARPFAELTVAENLMAGAYLVKDRRKIKSNLERVYDLFPRLKERRNQLAGTLSGGERQMLSIGRALMAQPKLLCIDEPSVGLAPKVKQDLLARIKQIHQEMGVTILLAEQDAVFAFKLSRRSYVLSKGRVIACGTPEELSKDEVLRKTYLGL